MDDRPLNILCFDGGGIRGLSSLLILRCLIQHLKIRSNLQTDPLPCEIFDLICGTSTGGLIALMLGRLRMSVEETIDCYLDLCKTVFEENPRKSPWSWLWGIWKRISLILSVIHKSRGRGGGRMYDSAVYDAETLEEWVKKVIRMHEGDGEAPLKDPRDGSPGCCPTFVVAITQSYVDAPPKRFRSYSTNRSLADSCRIWEAGRATTAASPFFAPMTIGMPPQTFIDGALAGANNPAQLAVEEAHDFFPGRRIGCFLSLGTGVPDVVSMKGNIKQIAEACVKLITSCERVDNAVGEDFIKDEEDTYYRFSVNRGLGNIGIAEWNRVEELSGITDGYMRGFREKEMARKCVEALAREVMRYQEKSID